MKKLKEVLPKWEEFKKIRWKIEEFFKFIKKGVGYTKYHQYTYKSVAKNTFIVALVAGIIPSTDLGQTTPLKQLIEM